MKRVSVNEKRRLTCVKGFVLTGCEEWAWICTSVIRQITPNAFAGFDLLKKTATNAAFSSEMRGKTSGGVV